jgi:hypothetical protein
MCQLVRQEVFLPGRIEAELMLRVASYWAASALHAQRQASGPEYVAVGKIYEFRKIL